ncbi:ATP-binding cassette domain-containing protein [bacterium]|nr:ATP-binding cassette domain-containing protein [bacterium]
MITLQNVLKVFNKTAAVDELSFNVPKGSVFGLLGPNGAGKTTTIRMIMNIIQPDSGDILIGGKPITADLYRNIGYLPEERGLYQKMKLKETIVYFGTLKGLSKRESAKQTDRYLEQFDLKSYADRKIEELSKGNQQKVQFVLAIIHEPDLIILDEPFAGLDPVNQMVLKDIISEFQSAGKTIIFSTHQMEQIEKLCSTICMINDGKRVLYGRLKDIKQHYSNRKFQIQFNGNNEQISDIMENGWELSRNQLSGAIDRSTNINDILKKVMSKVTISHVDIIEPSLEQIFIDQVKGGMKR